MQGNFVFMDFNSQSNWLNAAMLGARAVILIEPTDTVRREAENKLASVPLNLPKFWISKADYARLAAQGLGMRVRLRCRMAWENAQGLNLRVTLPGSDPELSRKLVCISTYYDSMSVVPALAPGAEAACGAAVMLELARLFKAQPPKCSIMFLAVGGHHLANSGMMAFLHQHARRRNPFQSAIEQPLNPDLMVCLDLTSQNETVGVTVEDGVILVPARRLYSREFLRHANLFCDYARRLEPALKHPATNLCMNLILPEGGGNWRAFLPEGISLDGVVALTGATPAFSLVTTYDPRLAADTPLDLPEKVNLDNLGL